MFVRAIRSTLGVLVAVCFLNASLTFGMDDKLPARLDGVDIEEKLGDVIPLDVQFMNEEGGMTSFGELLKDGNPIILTLNYSDCPGLCVAQLNGLSRGVNEVASLGLGKDFKMVSISINPRESRERAASTKAKYSESLADHHKGEAWSFLVGSEANIQKITRAVGFNYTFDAKHNRYNHAAAAIFVSPKGRDYSLPLRSWFYTRDAQDGTGGSRRREDRVFHGFVRSQVLSLRRA